jgi:DNA-directed RNA polymerase specialized sigma24 family protein
MLFEKRLEEIRKSYSKLNSHLRMVVQLRLEKKLSFPEIAGEMKTSTNNVTSWYSRAVKKLRKLHRK